MIGSNAGDPRSTPENGGDRLANAGQAEAPTEDDLSNQVAFVVREAVATINAVFAK